MKKRKQLNIKGLNIEALLINSTKSAYELGLITNNEMRRELDNIYSETKRSKLI